MTGANSPTPQGQLSKDPNTPDATQFNSPDLYFFQDTSTVKMICSFKLSIFYQKLVNLFSIFNKKTKTVN